MSDNYGVIQLKLVGLFGSLWNILSRVFWESEVRAYLYVPIYQGRGKEKEHAVIPIGVAVTYREKCLGASSTFR